MATTHEATEALSALAGRLGLDVNEPLLDLALTHRSAAYEGGGTPHNERLEFLGDSVLSVIVTTELYHRFPQLTEGHLARLRAAVVNMRALARIAKDLHVGPCLRLGRGEETTGGREKNSLLADALEALIGAVYLAQGIDAVGTLVRHHFIPLIEEAATRGAGLDWKTSLQELTSRHSLGVPEYRIDESGPDHAKQYAATVLIAGQPRGEGAGGSKKVSEQLAAEMAWRAIAKDVGEEDDALQVTK